MNQSAFVAFIAVATAASCFSPEYSDGTIACVPETGCPTGMACGVDRVCHTPDRLPTCSGTKPTVEVVQPLMCPGPELAVLRAQVGVAVQQFRWSHGADTPEVMVPAGRYSVAVKEYADCAEVESDPVDVATGPPTSVGIVCFGEPVSLRADKEGLVSFRWTIAGADPAEATAAEPVVVWGDVSSFDVQLVAMLANGCPFAATRSVQVAAFHGQATFDYTGGPQNFAVPDCVSRIEVDAYGAAGGDGDAADSGGLGGRTLAILPVAEGETITVYVGGAGKTVGTATDNGGFNGGGGVRDCCGTGLSGTGGGASDLRRGDALAERFLVAGGGGGGGWSGNGGTAGGGGGLIGGDGVSTKLDRPPGLGGTQDAGGQAGWTGTNYPNQPGSFGVGGICYRDGAGCGGGGGGWYGGGTGGFTGGGGGSGYVVPEATDVVFETGVRPGHGLVTMSW